MKKIVFTVFCSLAIIVLATSCGQKKKDTDGGDAKTEKANLKPAKDKYVKLAKEMNASMPKLYPGGIRMDKVEALSENEFRYVFTFTSEPAISVEEFVRNSKLPLSMGVSDGEGELKTLRNDKMTIVYTYKKLDGSLFAEIKISPDDYIK